MGIATITELEIDGIVWKSHKTGRQILIKDMVDEYLQSAIAMLKRGYDSHGDRYAEEMDDLLPYLEGEAIRRGLQPKEDGWDA